MEVKYKNLCQHSPKLKMQKHLSSLQYTWQYTIMILWAVSYFESCAQIQTHYRCFADAWSEKKKKTTMKRLYWLIYYPSTLYLLVMVLSIPVLTFNIKSEFYVQKQYFESVRWSPQHRRGFISSQNCWWICTCCCNSNSGNALLKPLYHLYEIVYNTSRCKGTYTCRLVFK